MQGLPDVAFGCGLVGGAVELLVELDVFGLVVGDGQRLVHGVYQAVQLIQRRLGDHASQLGDHQRLHGYAHVEGLAQLAYRDARDMGGALGGHLYQRAVAQKAHGLMDGGAGDL